MHGAVELARELGPDAIVLVCLSGRGDKDMDTAARWFDLLDAGRRRVTSGSPRRSPQRRRSRRATLVGYLPAGFRPPAGDASPR